MSDELIVRPVDPVLARLEQARAMLAEAKTIQDVKQIADRAAAAEVYARQQRLGQESIDFAHAIRVEALKRLGEIHLSTPKATGTRGQLQGRDPSGGSIVNPPENLVPSLEQLGVGKYEADQARKLFAMPNEQFEQVRAGAKSISQAVREVEHARRPSVPLPDLGTYRVLYADPPWHYGNSGVIGEGDNYGRAARHYPTMTIAELCALPVRDLADPDAVLFLWVTSPLLAECFEVIEAWGFTYKASFVWDKVKHNFGHYNSVRHEFLLIATRGSCTPDVHVLSDSVQSIERTESHSEKPEIFRGLIDALYPRGARLELFARRPAPEPWQTWGNEP